MATAGAIPSLLDSCREAAAAEIQGGSGRHSQLAADTIELLAIDEDGIGSSWAGRAGRGNRAVNAAGEAGCAVGLGEVKDSHVIRWDREIARDTSQRRLPHELSWERAAVELN